MKIIIFEVIFDIIRGKNRRKQGNMDMVVIFIPQATYFYV